MDLRPANSDRRERLRDHTWHDRRVQEFPEPTLRGFRSPRNPRAWVQESPEPTRVGPGVPGTHARGFRHSRNPRPPQSVGSEQSILRTHAFLEFHCRGWTWQTVLGFGCSRSFTDTVHGAEQKVLQELGQPADLVPHDDIALVKFVIS